MCKVCKLLSRPGDPIRSTENATVILAYESLGENIVTQQCTIHAIAAVYYMLTTGKDFEIVSAN